MTSVPPLRFRPDVTINVGYEDRTTFGSPIGAGPERAVRHAFAALFVDHERPTQRELTQRCTPELLDILRSSEVFGAMTLPAPDGWRVREEVLFPDPAACLPRLLTVARPDTDRVVRARLPMSYWPDVHMLVSSLCLRTLDAQAVAALHPNLRQLIEQFEAEELLEPAPDCVGAAPPAADGDIVFVGHNTVVVRSATASVLVDPLLFAPTAANPSGYQPLSVSEFGCPDAVAITHGHPDHFDPASLLRLPPCTTVVVPAVERESYLAPDLATRLRQLGFDDVRALRWGERTRVGDIQIRAYPFVGEQPTDGSWLHPEVRNQGCTYVVATPTLSAAFLADSGTDHAGRVTDVALDARRRDGPVDIVFAGYRGWLTYPLQLLASSVGRYALLIPPDLWHCRMALMSTADTAVDAAERWGASLLCPYADGGAPWHWRLGLGPQPDAPVGDADPFDPSPEVVTEAARRRSVALDGAGIDSPLRVEILRPGQRLRRSDSGDTFDVLETVGHRWPYPAPSRSWR